MKRLGQARGRACAPAHWLVLAPDPVSGPRVPGRCHHPSSQPPLPPAPLTSLLRVPSPRQRLTLGAGTGRARTRRSSGGGRRAGLGLHAPHLCRRARGSRHGAGAARERRDARRCPSGTRLQTSGGRLRAVPQQRQRPRRGGGTSPRRPALRARSSVHRDPRPGQLRLRRVRVSAAPCLRLAARGQLRSCGAGRGAGSGRAAGRRRRRAPASRRASRRPGRRCLLLLAGVESGRPCPGAGLADATEPLSPPAAALSCCPKWKRKPWDWRGRMGTRGRCRKTCKVSGRGALAPAATAPRAPRTWSWRRRRRAPPQGRHRSFGLSNRARWGIRQAMPDRPLPVERRFQLPGNPSRRLRPKGCGKGRSC